MNPFPVPPAMNDSKRDSQAPVSARIRERLRARSQRFHANDNISAFIEPGELEALTKEVESKCAACSRAW